MSDEKARTDPEVLPDRDPSEYPDFFVQEERVHPDQQSELGRAGTEAKPK